MENTSPLTIIFCISYLILVSIFMLWQGRWFSPDHFLVAAFIPALLIGRGWQYLKDWSPFIILFLVYEYLRGYAPLITKTVHTTELIVTDKFIFFGQVSPVFVQDKLFRLGQPQWYDYVAIIVYMLHFIAPFIVAFYFWLIDRKTYLEFAFALILLSFAALLTYIIFPATPPWLAAREGYLTLIHDVRAATGIPFAQALDFPTVYEFFRGNAVAAMPSLHAAYPILVLLFLVRKFGKIGFLFLIQVVLVWFATLYLGDHYLIDLIVGALYAVIVFLIVTKRKLLLHKLV